MQFTTTDKLSISSQFVIEVLLTTRKLVLLDRGQTSV